jgi:hypothetical protein
MSVVNILILAAHTTAAIRDIGSSFSTGATAPSPTAVQFSDGKEKDSSVQKPTPKKKVKQ